MFQDCCPHNLPGSWTYCLMVQKSNVHQLMLVVEIPWFTGVGIHPRWLFGSSWINNSIAIFFEGSLSPSHDESQTIVSSLFVFVFGVAPFLVNSLSAGIVGLGNSSKRIMRTRLFYYKCQCIKSSELGVWGQCSMKCLQSLILKHVFALPVPWFTMLKIHFFLISPQQESELAWVGLGVFHYFLEELFQICDRRSRFQLLKAVTLRGAA